MVINMVAVKRVSENEPAPGPFPSHAPALGTQVGHGHGPQISQDMGRMEGMSSFISAPEHDS